MYDEEPRQNRLREDARAEIPESRPTRTRRREAETEDVPKRDFLLHTLLVQALVCALLALCVFAMYRAGYSGFDTFRQAYTAIFGQDDELAALSDAVERFGDRVFGTQSDPESTVQTTEAASATVTAEDTDALTGAGGEDLQLAAENTSFAPYVITGAFRVPVEYTRVTSAFGYRINPVTDEAGFHSGIDLAAAHGSPIYAAFSGVVEETGYSDVRGNYIILSHGDDVQTVYCHCSEIIAEAGAVLNAGEVIARVGSTGQSTGAHLHFEVRIRGVRCNPAWLLIADAV